MALVDWGFTFCSFVALFTYIDDVIVVSDLVASIKQYLHDLFKKKDLGELHYFSYLEVAQSKQGLHICLKKFVLDLLEETCFSNYHPALNPIVQSCRLVKEGSSYADPSFYSKIVNKLLYLSNTKPDIAFVVQKLSQFL